MDAREFIDALDDLIKTRFHQHEHRDHDFHFDDPDFEETSEIIKRHLTDYLLEADPRKGVYVKGDHP